MAYISHRREEPARAHRRRHDGLQEGARRDQRRLRGGDRWLRAKGLAAGGEEVEPTAAEGLVGVAVNGTHGVAVEVNSETDFVANNEQFQDFVRDTHRARAQRRRTTSRR